LFKKGFDFILFKHRNCFSASVVNISQVFGSVLSGYFAGVIGRKKVILISSILMTSGWALIGFSDGNYHLLMAGRLIHGFAFLASVSQVYLAEISDAKRR
jgi:MFS family permease